MVRTGKVKLSVRAPRDAEPVIAVVRGAVPLSQSQARKLFATGKVYVDGALCTDWRRPVARGAKVTVDTDRKNPRRLPALRDEDLRHRDHCVVVVRKPANLVSVPPTRTGEPTLLDLLRERLAPDGLVPVALHRLDRETRGLMLFGIEGAPLAQLRRAITAHRVERAYFAVVEGDMESTTLEGTIDVSRTRYGGKAQTRQARTSFEVVARGEGVTLVRCRPHTGRYHQLRIQLADAGHPILGDREHGSGGRGGPRFLALQSCLLAFEHPETGQTLRFEESLDAELEALLRGRKEDA